MGKFICEICGGTTVVKQGDLFVCTSCGLGYTKEQLKTIMSQNDTVVQSEVNVSIPSNNNNQEKILQLARNAKQIEDWNNVVKYYSMVVENEPSNLEAIFYSAYGKAKASLIKEDMFARQDSFNILNNSLLKIAQLYTEEIYEQNKTFFDTIMNEIDSLINSSYTYHKNGLGETDTHYTKEVFIKLDNTRKQMIKTIANKMKKNKSIFLQYLIKEAENEITKINVNYEKSRLEEINEGICANLINSNKYIEIYKTIVSYTKMIENCCENYERNNKVVQVINGMKYIEREKYEFAERTYKKYSKRMENFNEYTEEYKNENSGKRTFAIMLAIIQVILMLYGCFGMSTEGSTLQAICLAISLPLIPISIVKIVKSSHGPDIDEEKAKLKKWKELYEKQKEVVDILSQY